MLQYVHNKTVIGINPCFYYLQVLNAQLNEFKENANLRAQQQQLIDMQLAAVDTFHEFLRNLKENFFSETTTDRFSRQNQDEVPSCHELRNLQEF